MTDLIDTSTVIADLRAGIYRAGFISVITLVEILRGIAEEKRKEVKKLLEAGFEVVDLDNEVIEKYCILYSDLRAKGQSLPDAHLLIAASAKSRDLDLVSSDEHFQRLGELGPRVRRP
mgnify:CR=1 FL=1